MGCMVKKQVRTILGSNLRKFRGRREWSQMELAEKAEISMNFLSEIERGNKWPSSETLQNLADSLVSRFMSYSDPIMKLILILAKTWNVFQMM